ncbi:MAG: hypothetical protein J5999_05755 [Oscillospiraceae bacterium]|nr:hypothetical protein [Oscillospiraceae bacterium]
MKKLFAAIIAVSCIALTACSGGNTEETVSETTADTTVSESVSESETTAETIVVDLQKDPLPELEGEQVAYFKSKTGKYIEKVCSMDVYTMTIVLSQSGSSMTVNMSSDGNIVGARANDEESDMSLIAENGLVYTYDHGVKEGIIIKDEGYISVVTPKTYFGEQLSAMLSDFMAVTEQTADGKTYTVESSYIGGDANDIISYWFDEEGTLVKFIETFTYDGVTSEVVAEVTRLSDTADENYISHFDDYQMSDFTDPEAFQSESSEDGESAIQGEIIAIEPADTEITEEITEE